MHLRSLFIVVTLLVFPVVGKSQAEEGMGIAAVVGDQAISSYDVDNRMRFVIATTKLSGTSEIMARIRPQVLRSLIDEKLQLNEAAKNSIAVSDDEIEQAIAGIEHQRGMPPGAIARMLEQSGVPKETFAQQIRAQLSWNQLMIKRIRPKVKVNDEEIEHARRKFSVPAVKRELKVAAITLPIDKPAREPEIRRLADKLAGEIRAGASFEEVGRQFSSSSIGSGGDIEAFWVRPEQMDPLIAKALAGASAGMVTPPVRTETNYTILKIYDSRALTQEEEKATEVQLKEILLRLKPDTQQKEADMMVAIGEDVAKHPGTCEEKGIAGLNNVQDFDIEVQFVRALLTELPPAVKIIAENLSVGDISPPFASEEGIRLYMLCNRREGVAKTIDRDQIANRLFVQKMELEAQKYMRKLRRDTFIELR